MSNSSLTAYTKLSPNNSGKRTASIDRITPHCVVGQCSVETLGALFAQSSRQASSNYGIGSDGRIGLYVDESMRSWCTSSNANDQRAVTIECASDTTDPFAFKDVVYNSLIKLCVDICQRNGKTVLLWLGGKDAALSYSPKSNEMVLTAHRWFANKSCPGDWMYARMADLATKVTAQLKGAPKYTVGWNSDDKGWFYSPDGETYLSHQWKKIDGDWYYFGNDGYILQNMTWDYGDYTYTADVSGKITWEEKKAPPDDSEGRETGAATEKRYYTAGELPDYYRGAVDALIAKDVIRGRGGSGDDLILDMGEDAVRVLVVLYQAGVFNI